MCLYHSTNGGDMVLIKPKEGECLEETVKEYEDLISTWFYDLRKWSIVMVQKEREVWIRCQGSTSCLVL